MTIKITLNGGRADIAPQQTITAFLDGQGYTKMLVAVAINGAFVPKSSHEDTLIHEGDNVEIVAPMQGG